MALSTVIITGAGSGIGRALSYEFASRGYDVLAVGRREEALKETQTFSPKKISILTADVCVENDRQKILDATSSYTNISLLIHNAGQLIPIGSFESLRLEDFQQHMKTNLEAPLFLTQLCLPKLSGGRVLHLSSGLAHLPMEKALPYCVSKAALYMAYQILKLELAKNNIAVGSVKPGIVDTTMQKPLREGSEVLEKDRAFFEALWNNKQLVLPKTVARFCAWLLCDIGAEQYSEQEWDIYDARHHAEWLGDVPVPRLD